MSGNIISRIRSATTRLALTYLAIIMLMSIFFSGIFYNTSYKQIDRQLPPDNYYQNPNWPGFKHDFDDFLHQRVHEARHDLIARLVLINLLILAGGSLLSYYLARRTIEPIEEAVAAQNRFVSDASHELRTPLTAIQASNEVALRKSKLSLPEAKDVIRQNTNDIIKLQAIADGLLKLAKGDSAQLLELGPVSVKSVIDEALATVAVAAKDKNITLDNKAPELFALADHQSLSQTLSILLDNAIKYSSSRTRVVVDAKAKGGQIIINVRDQGQGISSKDQAQIFKRFYRVEQSRTKNQEAGYGLGLSIAQSLIHQQNGDIWVNSKPGKGSTFSIKLDQTKKL